MLNWHKTGYRKRQDGVKFPQKGALKEGSCCKIPTKRSTDRRKLEAKSVVRSGENNVFERQVLIMN